MLYVVYVAVQGDGRTILFRSMGNGTDDHRCRNSNAGDKFFPKMQELKIGVIATTPLAGIYFADYMLIRNRRHKIENLDAYRNIRIEAILAWIAGSGVAYATNYVLFIVSTVPANDALFVSFAAYLLLSRFARHILGRSQSQIESA